MKFQFTLFYILLLSLISCQEKFSGNSDEEFKTSRINVEKNLNPEEKENLEKALRIITLYAMAEKLQDSDRYKKSVNDITLEIIDKKTYSDIVNFAEKFLKKENDKKIKNIESEISQLEIERNQADSIINILDRFKPNQIKIIKENLKTPEVEVEILYKGDLKEITQYMFDVEIYSISQNKRIDAIGIGGNFENSYTKNENDLFAYISLSLSPIIEKSKRLDEQLKNSNYPITDLKKYDLRLKVIPSEIILKNGTSYAYPQKNSANYDAEIDALDSQIKQLKTHRNTLDELEIQEKKAVYNEEFLSILEEIRKSPNQQEETSLKINKNLFLTFPSNFKIIKQNSPGMYSLYLSDSLTFNTDDENLIQYQITDGSNVECESFYDKANGELNILKKKNVIYDIKQTINNLKETEYYKLIDTDDSGYIYIRGDKYHLVRYFKIDDTHYSYTMEFKNIDGCIEEFDRSKTMIK